MGTKVEQKPVEVPQSTGNISKCPDEIVNELMQERSGDASTSKQSKVDLQELEEVKKQVKETRRLKIEEISGSSEAKKGQDLKPDSKQMLTGVEDEVFQPQG